MTSKIMLASGALFDILDPHGSDFTLHDIAFGLGRICRFAGHTDRFYSVAEHCWHVARFVPPALKRAALLHDASEAFIGDVTRPLKALLPEYQAIEARIEDAICTRFLSGDHAGGGGIKADRVKAVDIAMCLVEARELMPARPGYWSEIPVDPEIWEQVRKTRLKCDRPDFATAVWLSAWNRAGHMQEDYWTEGEAA